MFSSAPSSVPPAQELDTTMAKRATSNGCHQLWDPEQLRASLQLQQALQGLGTAVLTLPQGPKLGSAPGLLPHAHQESPWLPAPVDKETGSFCWALGNGQRPLCHDTPGPSMGKAGKTLPQRPSQPCKAKKREKEGEGDPAGS